MARLDAQVVDARLLAMASPILEDYLRTAGLARVDWFRLTLGPIGPTLTPLVLAASPNRRRGGGELTRTVRTWPEHTTFVGYSLGLFCLPAPSHAARRLELPAEAAAAFGLWQVWAVYGLAWHRPAGAWAEWRAAPTPGTAPLCYHFPSVLPRAEDLHELGRCADLLLGRSSRVGRPSRYADPAWRQLAARAEQLKAEHPELSLSVVAARIGIHEDTLRAYRRLLRREREAGDPAAPTVLGAVELPSAPGRRPEPDLERVHTG